MPFPIAPLRRFVESLMTESCAIERTVTTRDEYGDQTEVWAVVHSGVPCMRDALAGQERVLAERLTSEVNTKITMPFGTDVSTQDRIVLAGRRYSINYIPDVSPDLSASVEAVCQYIEDVS